MANGVTHAKVSLFAALPTAIALGAIGGADIGFIAGVGCVAGIPLTPDLDQMAVSKSEWRIVKYLPIIGWQWMALFDVYARLIPLRHQLSHWPVIGTLGRVLYLCLVGGSIWLLLGRPALPHVSFDHAVAFIAGLGVSDTLHWVWDFAVKKKRRKR